VYAEFETRGQSGFTELEFARMGVLTGLFQVRSECNDDIQRAQRGVESEFQVLLIEDGRKGRGQCRPLEGIPRACLLT